MHPVTFEMIVHIEDSCYTVLFVACMHILYHSTPFSAIKTALSQAIPLTCGALGARKTLTWRGVEEKNQAKSRFGFLGERIHENGEEEDAAQNDVLVKP